MTDSVQYREYLDRCAAELGDVAVGAYGKWRGKLVKKLTAEEFAARYIEYRNLESTLNETVERGNTISDALIRLLRECCADLLLDEPTS